MTSRPDARDTEGQDGSSGQPDLRVDACAVLGHETYSLTDEDGDGKTAWWGEQCGRRVQVDLSLAGNDDCDDTDPSRSVRAYPDADGDGWISPMFGCFGEVPAGYVVHPAPRIDCDDAAADRQVTVYGDRDGDGYGNTADVRCVRDFGGDGAPALTSAIPGDCDDTDPARNPSAPEQWADLVDSNCDGDDNPLHCAEGQCGCELLDTPPLAVDPSCAAPDLLFAKVETCNTCGGYDAVVVGNRGSTAVTGGFDITAETDGGTPLHVAEDLPPGGVSHPIPIAHGGFTARLSASVAECSLTNNTIDLPNTSGPCDP